MSASLHRPVLLQAALEGLAIRPSGLYVDGTFGRGGHSRAILDRLGPRGMLVAFDRDPEAEAEARGLRDPRFRFFRGRFSELGARLNDAGISRIDGLLLDLGVSSPQLDDPSRGFSFRSDGPLDMRMDPEHGIPAQEWLARASVQEMKDVIADYGEERFAQSIARAIAAQREIEPIATTRQLAAVVAKALRARRPEPGQDPATRTFQAIRIYVNQELEELPLVLGQTLSLLNPAGRLAVISFHSLEDRIVKRFIQRHEHPGSDTALVRLPLRQSELPRPLLRAVGRATKADSEEVEGNPRSRSAVLRVAARTAEPAP
jgi:16S rRNA (cytosine1402-N4)-methyltransferase